VKRNDQSIRLIASNRDPRNGMPPSGGYVYRGWYVDIMPEAITDDCATDYDTGIHEAYTTRDASVVSKSRCSRCLRVHKPQA
jgi:hypothetical protein